ncbi:MAG: hypothetical protein GXY33_12265 [Phycisphaerae bacterium]|nr:hypothetical protein [Phycisphaerae bacterium]
MESKDAYQEKMEAELKTLDGRIRELEGKAQEAEADRKIEYRHKVEDLKTKRGEARARLDQLKRSGGDAWKDMRSGFEHAYNDLRTAVTNAVSRFR